MLLADTNAVGGRLEDETISQALNISVATIEQSATAFGGGGVGSSIEPKAQNKQADAWTERKKHIIALTCSEPPMGQDVGQCGC